VKVGQQDSRNEVTQFRDAEARLQDYSLVTVFTGFVCAAFTERKLIVMRATVRVIKSDTIKGMTIDHTNGDNPKFIW